MELQTRLIPNDPARHFTDRVKAYTQEMIIFLQSYCFGATFGVGARCTIPSPPNAEDDTIYNTTPVLHGTHVNVITHLPPAVDYAPPPGGAPTCWY
jgi:hypothetical protein